MKIRKSEIMAQVARLEGRVAILEQRMNLPDAVLNDILRRDVDELPAPNAHYRKSVREVLGMEDWTAFEPTDEDLDQIDKLMDALINDHE